MLLKNLTSQILFISNVVVEFYTKMIVQATFTKKKKKKEYYAFFAQNVSAGFVKLS